MNTAVYFDYLCSAAHCRSHLGIHICVFTHWPNGWGTCLSRYEIALGCTVEALAALNKESEMDGPDSDEGQREEITLWQRG